MGNEKLEATLGEAIVRGQLPAPSYAVTGAYCADDFGKLAARICKIPEPAVRHATETKLEQLRLVLTDENILPDVLKRYLPERTGRYLVICTDETAKRSVTGRLPVLFGKLDPSPHVYEDDPAAFAADGSDSLKLYLCTLIPDGVKGVRGAVLFRRDLPPSEYKRLLASILAACAGEQCPILIDVAEGLTALDALGVVRREMALAVRELPENEIAVRDVAVKDETHGARTLYRELADVVGTPFAEMLAAARRYCDEHGDLDVPRRYRTADGLALGNWIAAQKKVLAGEQYGALDDAQIATLEALGLTPERSAGDTWERCFAEAVAYARAHGNLNVKAGEITGSGFPLGRWLAGLRRARRSESKTTILSDERIRALDDIGMIWNVSESAWEAHYAACAEYYRKHGDLAVPAGEVTADGLKLGRWVRRMRTLHKSGALTAEQIARLDDIGMYWKTRWETSWEQGLGAAREYHAAHGDLNVPVGWTSSSGFRLDRWLEERRVRGREKLPVGQVEALDALGMSWAHRDPWEDAFAAAQAYREAHGDLNVPEGESSDGIRLDRWLNAQRRLRAEGKLSHERAARLDTLGVDWDAKRLSPWEKQYEDAQAYLAEHGDLDVPKDYRGPHGKLLARWLTIQRAAAKAGKLTDAQTDKLEALGVDIDGPGRWETGFRHAQEYYEKYGTVAVPVRYVCPDGYKLGAWISKQRIRRNQPDNGGRLSPEQLYKLNSLGFVWNAQDAAWLEGFSHAEEYLSSLSGARWSTRYVSPDGYATGEWLRTQERKSRAGKLSPDRTVRLRALGVALEQPGSRAK